MNALVVIVVNVAVDGFDHLACGISRLQGEFPALTLDLAIVQGIIALYSQLFSPI